MENSEKEKSIRDSEDCQFTPFNLNILIIS
jgi:hypothetical protein